MKHTINGKHGHHIQLLRDVKPKPGKLFATKKVCISASEAARSEYDCLEIEVREKMSLKWNVCMWCWTPKPKQRLYGPPGMLLAKECGIGRCKAWGKPVKVNGLLTRKKKS